eukprot:TRINITY_DN113927_c0_g1_i1.p1 TRINITY_DN113927_c0_g1~~TRINITY_DN113927_c0_g1_i1.p1  ORF type:complete len:300 (+),score=48.98 TRINITY_DN113927_c0_g1_i1:24-902(+)
MSADEEELSLLLEAGALDADVGAGPPSPHSDDGLRSRQTRRDARSRSLSEEEEALQVGDASLQNFWHRAGWLVLLLFCQSSSSLILERFEVLIKRHPIVIYFLTMLVGAGGNAGGQSTVLVVRRLALAAAARCKGGKASKDAAFSLRRIVGPEIWVGAKLAVVLFLASLLRCLVFHVRGAECLAICLSMLAIVFTSTAIGAALPLLLSKFGLDPAHAGATIQVIMDVSGVALTCIISCAVLGVHGSEEPLHANSTTVTDELSSRHVSAGLQEVSVNRKTLHSLGNAQGLSQR